MLPLTSLPPPARLHPILPSKSKDFVPPDVSGLSKREARLVKNHAAAFLSRQRKREEDRGEDKPVDRYDVQASRKVEMFSSAHDLSIRDTEINNVGGDLTINHNYNVYLHPEFDSEPVQISLQPRGRSTSVLAWLLWVDSFSNRDLRSKIDYAVENVKTFLSRPFSLADIILNEKIADDALKYPPLFNVAVLLSKTSLFKDGVVNHLLFVLLSKSPPA
ncbi:hypothetical protein GALMADRAFT_139526 [Galerina marginata CBS 339.88]|uniref:Uncharacterized protein n=1 Tax=Galerina marginata (strain CBS 339.88) TaxID=685588 RepID=A0A067T2Q8_GALM3|nr:hypothetical protein GALMADRAFT_139526 [Galerina marginata CBS 339.88]